jgi:hypothetical protein
VPVTDTSLLMQSLEEDFLRYLDGPTPTAINNLVAMKKWYKNV